MENVQNTEAQVNDQAATDAAAQAKADAKAKADALRAEAKAKKDAEKAEAKRLKDEAAAKVKEEREAAKAKKEEEKAAAKAAKEEAARKAAEEKAAAASTKPAKVVMPSQHGVTRPRPEGKCGLVWALADKLSAELGQPVPISVLSKETAAAGLNDATTRTQYARWKTFNGVFGPVAKVAAPAPVAETPAASTEAAAS